MNGTYNGKNWRGRLICLLLAMALLSPGLGAEAEALSAKYMYTLVLQQAKLSPAQIS